MQKRLNLFLRTNKLEPNTNAGSSFILTSPSKKRRIEMENVTYTTPYIYKGKEWYVRYSCAHPDTGEFKYFTDRGGLNRIKKLKEKEVTAEALRVMYVDLLRNGWTPWGDKDKPVKAEPKSPELKTALANLITTKKTSIRRRTWQSYGYMLNCLVAWLESQNLGAMALNKFTDTHARAYHDYLLLSGQYKNKSINNQVGTLKTIFYMAHKRKLIKENPFVDIERLPEESGKHFAYSLEQKKKLKEAILKTDPAMWPFVKVIYHCFIRPIEILRLKVRDVDVKNASINIPSESAKNKKQLSVVIPDNFLKEVKAWHLEKCDENWYLFSRGTLKPGPKPYNRNSVTTRHSNIRNALKIDKRYDLYSWKHTGNVDSYRAGVPVVDIMRQNRHASLDETMNYLRELGLLPNIEYSKKAPKL